MVPLSLLNVTVQFGPDANQPALRDVSIQLRAAQWCAIIGPNGAGKSTLLRVAAGLLPPTSGQVTLQGTALCDLDRQSTAQQIALVPQRSEAAAGFTVREVIAMGRAPHQGAFLRTRQEDDEACDEAIRSCDLLLLSNRLVETLSGGEQQRVHIARALASRAPVLLLDEPGAHLDIRHSQSVYQLLAEQVAKRQLACAAVMHDLSAAARHADRVILLHEGRLVADGPPDTVMTAERLSETFETPLCVGRASGQRYVLPRAGPSSSDQPHGADELPDSQHARIST